MLKQSVRVALYLMVAVLAVLLQPAYAKPDKGHGGPKDDAYAAKLWTYMIDNQLVGEGRIRSHPFHGARPHGSIQEVISTTATIDGHKGRLIVKHNYGAKEGLTLKSIYSGDQDDAYEALTIMFQRKKGYDPDNHDWFWAEYNPDGSILVLQDEHLTGRAPACLGCHTALGGSDREILNGNVK